MANHTQTENGMGLKNKDGELIDWGDPFEIVHCNNPSTDFPEMKARVIHRLCNIGEIHNEKFKHIE